MVVVMVLPPFETTVNASPVPRIVASAVNSDSRSMRWVGSGPFHENEWSAVTISTLSRHWPLSLR